MHVRMCTYACIYVYLVIYLFIYLHKHIYMHGKPGAPHDSRPLGSRNLGLLFRSPLCGQELGVSTWELLKFGEGGVPF